MRHPALVLLASLAIAACSTAEQSGSTSESGAAAATAAAGTEPAFSPPEWTRNAAIYEVNVRQYTPEGTFAAFQRHLPRLDSLGVDILWLMPVQPIGKQARKGALGSYYSIADYSAVNPEHGTEADFRALVDAAHGLGMKVILDWVANHTAHDHHWTREHKDYYTLKPDGSISLPLDAEGKETDWTDVAELNYDNAEMRRAMIAEMKWWVDSMNVDGFRCDVAWGVPTDFFATARRELAASKPDLFWLAESEGPQYHQAFDMTYGWELHHLLNQVAKGEKGMDDLDAQFRKEDSLYAPGAMRMHFTSNHDENSWQGTEFERMGANHLPAFVVSATLERSMPLVYTGQEVSLNRRLRFFEKDTVDWRGTSLAPFYRAMLELKETQPAVANGAWGGEQTRLRTAGSDRVYAYTRTKGNNTVLVAVNFGDGPASVTYEGLARTGDYTDWFSKERPVMGATGRLEIPAHGYRVLVRGE